VTNNQRLLSLRRHTANQWHQWIFVFFSLFILASCGGASDGGGTDTITTGGVGSKLELTVLDAQGQPTSSTEAGTPVTVQVTVYDEFNNKASGIAVTFATTVGSMSQDSALSNANGVASASLITTTSQLGVTSITATATVSDKDLSLSKQVEISAFISNPPSINLTVYEASCTNVVTIIEAGQTLCLKTSVFQDSTPFVSQIVEYITTQGTPVPTSGLTDSSGVATAEVTSTLDMVGASTITATTTVDGTTYSDSENVEYSPFVVQPALDPVVKLTILNSNCIDPSNTAQATNALCLHAMLTKEDLPMVNEIISFTAPVGTLRQGTGLTDSDGVFTTQVDTLLGETGAATAVATHSTFSDTANYQFIPNVNNSATLTLTIKDDDCLVEQNTVSAGESLCLEAELTKDELPLVNEIVSFTSPLGGISPETSLTNSNGIAISKITSTPTTFGAAIATASFDGNTKTVNYQFTESPSQSQTELTITIRDQDCKNEINSTVVGTPLCIQVTLTDNEVAQAEEVVNFAATIGEFDPFTALTDVNGQASLMLTSTQVDVGAGTVTATFNDFVKSKNYEFLRNINADVIPLTLDILNESCTSISLSPIQGEKLCLKARLVDTDNNPIENTIVEFFATRGNLFPASGTTDANGETTVVLDTNNSSTGAGAISITVQNLTVSKNFEIIDANENKDLIVASYDADCNNTTSSVAAGTNICLKATLTDNAAPISDAIVSFIAPIGTLRPESALTDQNGVATVLIESQTSNLGAAQAIATHSNITAQTNYEFVDPDLQNTKTPQVTIVTKKNGDADNSFKVGETLQIEATVVDASEQVVANEIVSYTVERGQLNTTTALTNAQGVASVTLSAADATSIGAGAITAQVTLDNTAYASSYNYQILEADAVERDTARIGYFDQNGLFQNGQIGVSATNDSDGNGNLDLSAGGTLGLVVAVVNQANERIITPTPVTFASSCANSSTANLDENVTTVNGEARSTYEDLTCATTEGNQDTIVATITVNSVAISATLTIDLLPDSLGSIEFVSADPTNIVLRGTGGQGKQETSTLTFLVKSLLGNPVSQQAVNFSLDTEVGGLNVNPTTSFTNSQGLVTTRVTSGYVPAAVRVSATTQADSNITTQSDLLSVNTGLPDQNSITLSTNRSNPEAHSFSGVEVVVTAYMADTFNNPVPDGTTINFTTEGGFIQPSCNTVNGICNVTWTGTNPRVANHRITVLATAIGHETLFDVNGNNLFDDADTPNGDADIHNHPYTDSGLGRSLYEDAGFVDLSEAWRDDNENRQHDQGEVFIDYNNNQAFDGDDQKFNGPHCEHSTLCADPDNRKINVRKAIIMIMSGSEVIYTLSTSALTSSDSDPDYIGGEFVLLTNDTGNNITVDGGVQIDNSGTVALTENEIILDEGHSISLTLHVSDDALGLGQILPSGTAISISTNFGSVTGNTSFIVPDSIGYNNVTGADQYGGNSINFSLVNTNSTTDTGNTTQSGTLSIQVTLADSQEQIVVSVPFTMIGR